MFQKVKALIAKWQQSGDSAGTVTGSVQDQAFREMRLKRRQEYVESDRKLLETLKNDISEERMKEEWDIVRGKHRK